MNHPFGNGTHTTYKNGEIEWGWSLWLFYQAVRGESSWEQLNTQLMAQRKYLLQMLWVMNSGSTMWLYRTVYYICVYIYIYTYAYSILYSMYMCIKLYKYIYISYSYRYVLLQSSLFHVISLMLNCHVCRVSPVKTRVNKPTNWGEPPVLQAGAPQF